MILFSTKDTEMRGIRYVTCLAAGLILLPVSAGPIRMQNSEAAGIYFPPNGRSTANQDRRRPQEVGMRPHFIARIKERMKGNRWALWRHGYLVHVEGDFNKNTEVASLRKTWHALTVGAAIGQNRIPSAQQKISVWCKELTGKDAEATWRDVITQT